MRLLYLLSISLVSLFLTSCSTSKVTHSRKILEINHTGVIQMPIVVDLEISEIKVSGKASDGEIVLTIEELKDMAVSDAIKNAECDILIDPTFETSVKGMKTEVMVTGYPGKYKNFRSLSAEDVQILQNLKLIETSPVLIINETNDN